MSLLDNVKVFFDQAAKKMRLMTMSGRMLEEPDRIIEVKIPEPRTANPKCSEDIESSTTTPAGLTRAAFVTTQPSRWMRS